MKINNRSDVTKNMKLKFRKERGNWTCQCGLGIIGEGHLPIVAYLHWQLKVKRNREARI